MCGICGFFGKKKNKREIVEKMKEKLVHRGPDAQGSFVNDSVALGFRRLSIIDLEGGLQPMKSSSQNLTVVFNGEIYNYQELREQMEREKKILFVTRSDSLLSKKTEFVCLEFCDRQGESITKFQTYKRYKIQQMQNLTDTKSNRQERILQE